MAKMGRQLLFLLLAFSISLFPGLSSARLISPVAVEKSEVYRNTSLLPVKPYVLHERSDAKLLRRVFPEGRWRIDMDYTGEVIRPNFMHFSSRIEEIWDDSENQIPISGLSPGMLIAAAREALNDMYHWLDSNQVSPNSWPSTMAVLRVGEKLYLSSSIKNNGAGFICTFGPTSPTSVALTRCAGANAAIFVSQNAIDEGRIHRIGANCAEIGAVHLYSLDESVKWKGDTNLPAGALIVTYGQYPPVEQQPPVQEVFNPCGGSVQAQPGVPQWGCNRFLQTVGLNFVPRNTPEVPIPIGWRMETKRVCL